jgi:hypothetical protein
MSAWDHLPNAAHIDRVLASVKSYPELWDQAWGQVWSQSLGQVWSQAFDQVWHRAFDQAFDQVWVQARYQAIDQVSFRARGALLALIAYDDCAKYLDLPLDQLQMLYHLTEHPACILLQPAVLVFEKEKELA